MSIAAGTPTVIDQAKALWDELTHHTSAADQTVLAGLQRDFTSTINSLETAFGPVVKTIEADAFSDVTTFLNGIASAIPVGSVTSLTAIVNVVKAAVSAMGGPIATQIGSLESTALHTLVGAAAVAAGHVNLSA
jgi:hypothetical protein